MARLKLVVEFGPEEEGYEFHYRVGSMDKESVLRALNGIAETLLEDGAVNCGLCGNQVEVRANFDAKAARSIMYPRQK